MLKYEEESWSKVRPKDELKKKGLLVCFIIKVKTYLCGSKIILEVALRPVYFEFGLI